MNVWIYKGMSGESKAVNVLMPNSVISYIPDIKNSKLSSTAMTIPDRAQFMRNLAFPV